MNAVLGPLVQTESFYQLWLGLVYGLVFLWLGYRVSQLFSIPTKVLRSVLGLVPPPVPVVILSGVGAKTVEVRCSITDQKNISSLLLFVNNVFGKSTHTKFDYFFFFFQL